LGYHDADKGHELYKEKEGGIGAWDRIDKAYKSGMSAKPKSSSNQANAKTEETT